MDTKPIPEVIFASDGLRTILNIPWECPGCHGMHYFFIRTADGHRCPSCASESTNVAQDLPVISASIKNIGDL